MSTDAPPSPPSIPPPMIVTPFRPDFRMHVAKDGTKLGFTSPRTGGVFTFDCLTHKLAGMTEPASDVPIFTAASYELQYTRWHGPTSPLMSGDRNDDEKNSHTTGGGRRSFTSIAFNHMVRGIADGRDALVSWSRDQGRRPVAWWPWVFSYDAYYGVLGTDHKNPLWQYDKQDAEGWSIFDPAHLESSALFCGAAAGLDESLAHLSILAAWVFSTFPGVLPNGGGAAKGWTGSWQSRAAGWMILFAARCSLIGMDGCDAAYRDVFLAGSTPKKHLIGYLRDLMANPLPLGGEKPDERTMVDFKDGSNEVAGYTLTQEAILFFAIGYVLRSGLVSDQNLAHDLFMWAKDRATKVAARGIDVRGMSYAISTHGQFTQDCVAAANLAEKDPGHVYELVGAAPNFMRDAPRFQDCELMLGGLAVLVGTTGVAGLDVVVPKPGDPAYADRARYADPYWKFLEDGK